VVEAVDEAGNTRILVSSSERSLSAAQRALLTEGETAVSGAGHAEVTGLNKPLRMLARPRPAH
jgi:hypothetical protein